MTYVPKIAGGSGGGGYTPKIAKETTARQSGGRKSRKSFFGRVGSVLSGGGHEILGFVPGLAYAGEKVGRGMVDPFILLGQGKPEEALRAAILNRGVKEGVVEPTVAGYRYKYGPAFHGDFGETLHRMGETPIATALDIITPFTLGTAAAVRAPFTIGKVPLLGKGLAPRSVLLRGEGAIVDAIDSEASALAGATRAGKATIEIPITGSELTRRLKIARNHYLNRLHPDHAILGRWAEPARAARAISRKSARDTRRYQIVATHLQAAEAALSPVEMAAVKYRVRLRTVEYLKAYRERIRRESPDAPEIQRLDDPEVLKRFEEPTKKMLEWEKWHKEVTRLGEELTGIDAPIRPYQDILMALGYNYMEPHLSKGLLLRRKEVARAQLELQRALKERNKNVFSRQDVEQIKKAGEPITVEQAEALGSVRAFGKNEPLFESPPIFDEAGRQVIIPGEATLYPQSTVRVRSARSTLSRAKNRLETGEKILAARRSRVLGRPVTVEEIRRQFEPGWYREENGQLIPATEEVARIQAELEAAGLEPPVYYPHHAVEDTPPRYRGGSRRSARVRKKQEPASYRGKRNKGTLALLGRAAVDIDVVTPEFLRKLMWATRSDRQADLIALGEKVDKGYVLGPREHFVVTDSPIGYTEATAGEFLRRQGVKGIEDQRGLAKVMGEDRSQLSGLGDDLIEGEVGEVAQKSRVVVSDSVAKAIISEYESTSRWLDILYNKPTVIWRALVLNLRIGWLVNNILGNSLMFLLANAGEESANVIRGLQGLRGNVSKSFVERRVPEQATTMIGSQVPTLRAQSTIGRGAVALIQGKFAPSRILRKLDVATERGLRKRMLSNQLKKNPEFRKFYEELPKQADRFEKAAEKFADMNPKQIELISKEINDAMGNFFDLGHTERIALRGIFPFYAWYKAITGVAVRMPFDHPLRATIFIKLGDIGREVQADDYGLSYLNGSIQLPYGYRLRGKAMNPFATVVDLGSAAIGAGSLFGAPVGRDQLYALGGLYNPVLTIPGSIQALQAPFADRSRVGLPGTVRSLPFANLAFPRESDLYEGNDYLRALYGYLGFPVTKVREGEARRRASER